MGVLEMGPTEMMSEIFDSTTAFETSMAALVAPVLEALENLSKLGLPGQIGYVLALSAWTALCLPTTPIELTAGFCFSKHVAMITSE